MCARRFQLPLPTLPSSSEPRPFRSEGYQHAGCGGTSHKLNSQNCVFLGGRSLLPTRTCELEPSYTLIEEGLWKSLCSPHIHVRSEKTIPHAFLTTSPTTNMRVLGTSTLRQDAGGFFPEHSSQREACLEARSQLAALLWQREGSSILSQEVPRLPLFGTWR